ncbi:MAG: T9SS type A sorting domain-containing protein [Fimbriimonadaceae bacterium]|nr:T9SS type A sorting domain-containing protein [Chitinophagales bacterium]
MKKLTFTLIILFHAFVNAFGQWQETGSGITESPRIIWGISVVDSQTVWAIADHPLLFGDSKVFTKTVNAGATWLSGQIDESLTNHFPGNIFALDENTAWVIMIEYPAQDKIKIYKTIDGGTSWIEQAGEFNDSGHAFAALYFFNENEGVGFGSPGTGDPAIDSLQIFRTANGGDTWSRIPPSELPTPLEEEGVWVYSGNGSYDAVGDNLWFVTRTNRLFRTTDKGLTWEAYNTGITNPSGLTSIAFQDANTGIAVTYGPQKGSKTIDGGETWETIILPSSPPAAAIEFIPGTENTYIIGDGFVFDNDELSISTDGGETWTTETYSPSTINCFQFTSPTNGWAGGEIISTTEGGMYKWVGNLASEDTVIGIDDDIMEIKLQIFPNPSSGILFISNTDNCLIENISITDNAGKFIMSFEKPEKDASINISHLPNGLYQLHIKTNKYAMIKNMVLNKD